MPYSQSVVVSILKSVNYLPKEITIYHNLTEAILPSFIAKDLIDYCLSSQEQAKEKTVCFLCGVSAPPYIALIVEYLQVNKSILKELLKLLQQSKSIENIIDSSLLKCLYGKIKCRLVGNLEQSEIQQWQNLLTNVYSWPEISIDPIGTQNQDIVFTEILLRRLSDRATDEIDIRAAYLSHHKHVVDVFIKKLNNYQTSSVMYKKIEDLLNRLLKYSVLMTEREKLNFSTATLAQLKKIAAYDNFQKKQIYRTSYSEMSSYINSIQIDTLSTLISFEKIEDWITYLEDAAKFKLKEMKAWEQKFQWVLKKREYISIEYFRELSQKAWDTIYQNSFIGLFSELSQWFGQFPGIFIERKTNKFISQEKITSGFKWVGAGVGAVCTYFAGSYYMGRTFAVNLMGRQLKNYFADETIDDQYATIKTKQRFLRELPAFTRISGLALASIESWLTGDVHHLVCVVGSIGGSASSIEIAKRALPYFIKFRKHENEQVALFFISMSGYVTGMYLFSYGHQGLDKLLTREKLHTAFCELTTEKNYAGCALTFKDKPHNSFSFWLNSEDRVRVGWNQQKQFIESDCEIIKLSNGNHSLICEEPVVTQTLRLT